MPKLQLKFSVLMEAKPHQLFELIRDFTTWKQWNPWLISDPLAFFDVSPGGESCRWLSRVLGSGDMKVVAEVRNESVEFIMHVESPRRYEAHSKIELFEEDGKTRFDWYFNTKVSFWKQFSSKSVADEIRFDFCRGKENMLDLIRYGELRSRQEITGGQGRFGYEYVGFRRRVPIPELGKHLISDFEKLIPYSKKTMPNRDRPWPFVIYHEWDMSNYEVTYTSCVSIMDLPDVLPEGMVSGRTQKTKVYTVAHTGDLKNIVNPWRTLRYLEMNDLLDVDHEVGNKAVQYFRTGPLDVPEAEIESDITIAIREVDIMSDKEYLG